MHKLLIESYGQLKKRKSRDPNILNIYRTELINKSEFDKNNLDVDDSYASDIIQDNNPLARTS